MLGAVLAMVATAADARAVKWARAADALTLDPHGQNEGPTIAFNGQIYEPLIARDNANKLVPALATSWKLVDPTTFRKDSAWAPTDSSGPTSFKNHVCPSRGMMAASIRSPPWWG